jgi:hypothetical protein
MKLQKKKYSDSIAIGQPIRVTQGILSGIEGIILAGADSDRPTVLLENRIRLQIDRNQIVPA